MSFHFKSICTLEIVCALILHYLVLTQAILPYQHQFVVQLSGNPAQSNWKPVDQNINEELNEIDGLCHGIDITIRSEFCFTVARRVFIIDLTEDKNGVYTAHDMYPDPHGYSDDYEVRKNLQSNQWEIRKVNSWTGSGPWSNVADLTVIDRSWQGRGDNWKQDINQVFDDSISRIKNQVCAYSKDADTWYNYAFYDSATLQSLSRYGPAFRTGLNECVGNQYIAVQWPADAWYKKRPVCILENPDPRVAEMVHFMRTSTGNNNINVVEQYKILVERLLRSYWEYKSEVYMLKEVNQELEAENEELKQQINDLGKTKPILQRR